MECRAHIDALEQAAAERVIADGSRGPTPDYTGEGSAWVPPAEARAVVVPARDLDGLWQIVEREREWRLQDSECGGDEIRESVGRLRREWDEATSSLRTIPADRVLGEGMVAVDREELHQLRGLESCARAVMAYDGLLGTEERNRLKRLDAIRANQGGAAT